LEAIGEIIMNVPGKDFTKLVDGDAVAHTRGKVDDGLALERRHLALCGGKREGERE
jgi:hypothetical protein